MAVAWAVVAWAWVLLEREWPLVLKVPRLRKALLLTRDCRTAF